MAARILHPALNGESSRERECREQVNELSRENARLTQLVLTLSGALEYRKNEKDVLEARISAGIWRRTRLFHIACALLKAEDDETLTDEQHEALMDDAIRHARTIVSLERLAREEDRARMVAKEGA